MNVLISRFLCAGILSVFFLSYRDRAPSMRYYAQARQDRKISGITVDEKNKLLGGVTISVANMKDTSTASDSFGKFFIIVPGNDQSVVLTFRKKGYIAATYVANVPGSFTMPLKRNPPPYHIDRERTVDFALGKDKEIRINVSDSYGKSSNAIRIVKQPRRGYVSIDFMENSLIYKTNDDSCVGIDSFVYSISNKVHAKYTKINVLFGKPVIEAGTYPIVETPYNTPARLNLLEKGQGVDRRVELVNPPKGASLGRDGKTLTYIPSAGECGEVIIDYIVRGACDTQDSGTVTIRVEKPVIEAGTYPIVETPYNTPVQLDLLEKGQGVDRRVELVNPPKGASLGRDGKTLTYTPTAGVCGDVIVYYNVRGACDTQDSATVTIRVGKPVIKAESYSVETPYNTPVRLNPLQRLRGTDSYTGIVLPDNHPTGVSVGNDGKSLTYTPAAGVCGDVIVYYIVRGACDTQDGGTITIRVGKPVITAESYSVETPYNTPVRLDLLERGQGVDRRVDLPPSSQPKGVSLEEDGKTLTYTPAAGVCGDVIVYYTVRGACDTQSIGTVTIRVGKPVITAESYSVETPYNTPVRLDLLERGQGGDRRVELSPRNQPKGMSLDEDGKTLTYTPGAGVCGDVIVYYTVRGACDTQGSGKITIRVGKPPIPVYKEVSTTYNKSVDIKVLERPEDGILSYDQPANGRVDRHPDNVSLIYTPDTDIKKTPTDIFTYYIKNCAGTGSASIKVRLNHSPGRIRVKIALVSITVVNNGDWYGKATWAADVLANNNLIMQVNQSKYGNKTTYYPKNVPPFNYSVEEDEALTLEVRAYKVGAKDIMLSGQSSAIEWELLNTLSTNEQTVIVRDNDALTEGEFVFKFHITKLQKP